MRQAEQACPRRLCWPDEAVRALRARLILEEALETVQALGFVPEVWCEIEEVDGEPPIKRNPNFNLTPRVDVVEDMRFFGRIAEVVDGCCDLKVVTTGTLTAFGIPDAAFQRECDLNNMLKFTRPGGHRREDGKWIKPADHPAPAFIDLLQMLQTVQEQERKEEQADEHANAGQS